MTSLTSLTSCGWEVAPLPGNVITGTRMLGTRFEVIELGPALPDRVGFDPDDPPITEAMPGDWVRLEAMIVGEDGHPIAPEPFDGIWFQLGFGPPSLRCEDIEWTHDVGCEIGRGGAVEFEAPPLGPHAVLGIDQRLAVRTLAILALDEQITADECLALYRAPTPEIRRCGIVTGAYRLGPMWPLLVLTAAAGVPVDFPITEIPAPALAWPANRAPAPGTPRFAGYTDLDPIVGNPLQVHVGQQVIGMGPLWRRRDREPFLKATEVVEGESYVFQPSRELVDADWYSTASLHAVEGGPDSVWFEVVGDPGPARLIMVFKDSRDAYGLRVFEFEVVP